MSKAEISRLEKLLEKDNQRGCWCTDYEECGCDSTDRWFYRHFLEDEIKKLKSLPKPSNK